jgi:hypothetical protein
MPEQEPAGTVLHFDPKQMWLPISLVAAVVVTIAAGAWTLSGWVDALDRNTVAVSKLEGRMDAVLDHHRMLQVWAFDLARKNPTLTVPEIPR